MQMLCINITHTSTIKIENARLKQKLEQSATSLEQLDKSNLEFNQVHLNNI